MALTGPSPYATHGRSSGPSLTAGSVVPSAQAVIRPPPTPTRHPSTSRLNTGYRTRRSDRTRTRIRRPPGRGGPPRVTVLTNSLAVTQAVAETPGIEHVVLGGRFRPVGGTLRRPAHAADRRTLHTANGLHQCQRPRRRRHHRRRPRRGPPQGGRHRTRRPRRRRSRSQQGRRHRLRPRVPALGHRHHHHRPHQPRTRSALQDRRRPADHRARLTTTRLPRPKLAPVAANSSDAPRHAKSCWRLGRMGSHAPTSAVALALHGRR